MRKKIGYVDGIFHKKTRSTFFLSDILEEAGYGITRYWDKDSEPFDLSQAKGNDALVLFQFLGKFRGKLRDVHPNITFIPMLDGFLFEMGVATNLTDCWRVLRGVKVLNFSKALHNAVLSHGLVSRYFQYYQEPAQLRRDTQGLHGFFWCRRPKSISFDKIRKLIEGTKFDSFHIHLVPDPGEPAPLLPTDEEMKFHNITISTWFENKADFESVLSKANVFFAPRPSEGIGQAMLEAFARGQCVVSPDHGTMNEYITHEENGLLYDMDDPKPLCFDNIYNMGLRAWERNKRGYANWQNSKHKIVEFIATEPRILYENSKYYHGYAIPPMSVADRLAQNRIVSSLKPVLKPIWRTYCKLFKR